VVPRRPHAPRLPGRELPLDRQALSGDADQDQRLPGARDQCHARTDLGQFFVRDLQVPEIRRAIEVYDPTDETKPYRFDTPAGGPGYYRPPSLAAIWSSAPFLHNNSVGIFTGDPSVAGRMRAFDDAIEKLLWPEKRLGKESIWRTTQESYLRIPEAFVPVALRPLVRDGYLSLGPIPKGMPINLLANIDPTARNFRDLALAANKALLDLAGQKLTAGSGIAPAPGEPVKTLLRSLMAASKCPDLIEDRGHDFGTHLPDSDKRALIEFLKTM